MAETHIERFSWLFKGLLQATGTVKLPTTTTLNDVSMANFTRGVASGYAIARGTQAATASAAIATGLTTITGFAITGVGATATKMNAARAFSGATSSGTLTAYRWKHTGASTATLVAATTAGTVAWVAVGTI